MTAKILPLSELLRAGGPRGAPVEVLLDSWALVEDALLADSARAREDLTAASDALPAIGGALADRRSLATAVMTARGDVCFADRAYRALFRDSGDLRPLLKRALSDGPVVSLVEGAAGAAFTAWVGDAASAARWQLEPEASAVLQAAPGRLVVVVSAPSRSSELARRAARALDLTALEARLAEALLFAPNLDVAAADAGVGRETARDALRRINAKAGVRRTPELVARLIGIMCAAGGDAAGEPGGDEAIAESAFGLTPAEARAATLVARGATSPEAAQVLGVRPETVKTHIKSVLQKTGAKGAKDLARLLVEARELVALADATEAVLGEEEGGGRLRILSALDGARRIALIDYGPYDGEPLFVFHGAAAGRRLPDRFRAGLVAAGYRPIVLQRPGFGLTDPATADYVTAGAADMAAAVEHLRLKSAHMLARDTGIPVALGFACAYPQLLGRVAILNPHPPMSLADDRDTFVAGVQKHLLRNPDLVAVFAEFLRRQATTQLLERILHRAFSDVPPDASALREPAVRQFLIRDIQALCARSVWGFASEHAVYANGWEAPAGLPAKAWTLAFSSELPGCRDPAWLGIADVRRCTLEGAGVLPQFTHPDAVVALLA
ncbi:alpha/beta fold hydrolase [uncultured Phenylobacterium sp.]|uniref:alpha/beta fold hydrolase n=1 Tax=uncultured Phenylobacterium sp. TaxID=349273 RepID=UPI0025D3F4E8|nr:alpha/beta fold hydrolase [uncultured Phenylobacterium sp.]